MRKSRDAAARERISRCALPVKRVRLTRFTGKPFEEMCRVACKGRTQRVEICEGAMATRRSARRPRPTVERICRTCALSGCSRLPAGRLPSTQGTGHRQCAGGRFREGRSAALSRIAAATRSSGPDLQGGQDRASMRASHLVSCPQTIWRQCRRNAKDGCGGSQLP
jgi:hypothetical protein